MSSRGVCKQCQVGWAPPDVKTFNPSCPKCQEKLKAGKRTGKEPHPNELRLAYRPQVRYPRGRKAA